MKKSLTSILAFGLAGTMLLGLTACGGNEDKEPMGPPAPDSSVTDNNGENSGDTSNEVVADVKVEDVLTTLKNTYGERYLPQMPVDQETFEALTGLTAEQYSAFAAEFPMMSAHVDKVFIVKTDKPAEVKTALETYHEGQKEGAMQYPMNKIKVEKAVIYEKGDYVIYMILGGYTEEMIENDGTKTDAEMEAAQTELETKYYDEQNKLGTDALDELFKTGKVPGTN